MTLNKKIFSFATLTLLVAASLSGIAAWYSIQGLVAIFSAAIVPITIMGGSLEFAKVITTVWLHNYWNRAGIAMKLYLIPAVISLALLTSMGIFGFLSKSHSDQVLVSGDVQSKVAVYDQRIQNAKDTIAADKKALQQMDSQVDQILGRTTDDKGANRSVAVRRQQSAERERLNKEIETSQNIIAKQNEESAPIRAQIRKVEAEVGPIKYIAALIYGDNPDANLLERAVRWVIILIVFVFDPLALTLVLAAQSSYKWLEEDERAKALEEEKDEPKIEPVQEEEIVHDKCGTPECCGTCDTAVDKEFLEMLSATKIKDIKEDPIDAIKIVQKINSRPDDRSRQDDDEAHHTDADSNVDELEPSEVGSDEETDRLETEGVTFHENDAGYVQIKGKSVSKNALVGLYPDLFSAKPDLENKSNTNFGTEFPKFAKKADIFVRVDILPNKVFKFNGEKWIEINKDTTDSYLYDEEYIRHLVEKIESGEYDIELLSENEKVQIEEYLQGIQNTG